MNKEIKYNGVTNDPSDYSSNDGDLELSIGLAPDDGALKPILQPKTIINIPDGYTILYAHETSKFSHYIIYDKKKLYWITLSDKNISDKNKLNGENEIISEVTHVNAIGNTLLVFTTYSIQYFLWKIDTYISLGNHIPNIAISFGLRGTPILYSLCDYKGRSFNNRDTSTRGTFNINFDGINKNNLYETWTEANQNKITEQVMAKVNKFLSEQTIEKGSFALPFFVRYALRLYDGSLICHSAPILMNPSTSTAPIVLWNRVSGKDSYSNAECDIMLVSSILDYKLMIDNESDYQTIKNWKDIIKSIDVFISKPIYSYDQDGKCTNFNDTDNFKSTFIGTLNFRGTKKEPTNENILIPLKLDGVTYDESGNSYGFNPKNFSLGTKYVEWGYDYLYALFYNKDRNYPSTSIHLPEFTNDKNKETLNNVSLFYFLKSIELDELSSSERKDIIISNDYLQSLTNREVMTDDYLSHDNLIAKYSNIYNNRLNLSGVSRHLFKGFMPESMFAYTNAEKPSWSTVDSILTIYLYNQANTNINIDVYIRENGETYCVSQLGKEYMSYFCSIVDTTKKSWGSYVFYPNVNAFKMIIKDNFNSKYYEINLKTHEFLNGAYDLIDYETVRSENYDFENLPKVSDINNTIYMPNKIYTSEVNNPFRFLATGINTVGTGSILGISSAAKALSQGQFGQFPLYAFTSDGIWALEVSSTGAYSAKQPITRDVCINYNSITQIDSAVLFATDRGIMMISGSQSSCISDTIASENYFKVTNLPHFDKIIVSTDLTTNDFNTQPFSTFLRNCHIIYDYTHQHIIVYNSLYNYSYVYSFKDKAWGMMKNNITYSINSYPEALAVTKDNTLVDFSKAKNINTFNGVIITRPLKIDAPDVMKTIDSIIQRGYFRKGHISSVLYGSNDLFNWILIWSSSDHYLRGFHGSPYKYYRLVIVCNFEADENIYGCSIQFTPRLNNKSR